jgi:peptidylprolyl isomerase
MAQAKQGDTVNVHYTGKFDDGTVFDSSSNRDPLEFTLGEGQVIPGFENGIMGMTLGDTKTIETPAEEAYGPHYSEMVIVVDRNEFPPDLHPDVGDQLQLQQPDGEMVMVTVTDADDESVTLDGNHPLAGKALTFDIELVGIR